MFPAGDPSKKKRKLELLSSFSLFGNIVSMQSVRLAGAVRDSLLVSFREAKVSSSQEWRGFSKTTSLMICI